MEKNEDFFKKYLENEKIVFKKYLENEKFVFKKYLENEKFVSTALHCENGFIVWKFKFSSFFFFQFLL